MLLRGLRIAQGGARAEAEIQRMITEKVAALAEAQVAATVATLKQFVVRSGAPGAIESGG